MPRLMPANLIAIFAGETRDIEYLLDIVFPSIAPLRYATGELIKNLIDYDNGIESVSDLRQNIETPINNVRITLGNKDLFFDWHIAENFDEWRNAEAILYRRYSNAAKTITQDVIFFTGSVQSPIFDEKDYTLSFDIFPDTISKGLIVANRTLALACSFVFGDAATCGYFGTALICNHLLSQCSRYLNSEHFGGTQSRYTHRTSTPGSAGNPDTGGNQNGGPTGCPALDQFVLVESSDSKPIPILVAELTAADSLFNPVTKTFEPVRATEIIETVLFEIVCAGGAKSTASATHPLVRNIEDGGGLRIMEQRTGFEVLNYLDDDLRQLEIVSIRAAGKGFVMRIETAGPTHIYASGQAPGAMIVCHNSPIIKQGGNQA